MSGILFVVAAPSGAGKTTLVRLLLEKEPDIRLSVSCTTRPARPGEKDGHAYHFISVDEFLSMRNRGDFLEWAEVHGNYYGTSRTWISAQQAEGHDVLLEIDWQGAQQVRSMFPDAVEIFILPPDMETLAARLAGRGTDNADVVARRLAAAEEEMRHAREFDYVIINQELHQALEDLCAIVRSSRLRLNDQRYRHPALFSRLMT